MASIHITKGISSFIKVGYSLGLSKIERGLQIDLVGLSDEKIIKYLIKVVMKSKFSSLTSTVLLYLVYYYTTHEYLAGACRVET